MSESNSRPETETRFVTHDWSWWSDFLQREYYSGATESGGWDAVATAIARHLALEPGMRLLDLGSGAGDIVLRMALRGLNATGVEQSKPLVEHCRQRAREMGVAAAFIGSDMFSFEPTDRFDAILSLNTSFGYGSDEQNRELIVRIGRWLRPGGAFLLDVVTADAAVSFGHWEDDMAGGRLIVENEYDHDAQTMTSDPAWRSRDGMTMIRAESPEVVRIYRRSEVESMLTEAGLAPTRLRRAMARTWVQDDRHMQTTWVARPCSQCPDIPILPAGDGT